MQSKFHTYIWRKCRTYLIGFWESIDTLISTAEIFEKANRVYQSGCFQKYHNKYLGIKCVQDLSLDTDKSKLDLNKTLFCNVHYQNIDLDTYICYS